MTVGYRVQYDGQNQPEGSSEDSSGGLTDPYLSEAFLVSPLWFFHGNAILTIDAEVACCLELSRLEYSRN